MTNPDRAIPSSASPRPATATCVACSSAAPNTSSDPSDPIVICAAGVSSSPSVEARTPRRERWWPWPASWPSSSTAYGSPGKSTTPSTIPIRIRHRQPKPTCAFGSRKLSALEIIRAMTVIQSCCEEDPRPRPIPISFPGYASFGVTATSGWASRKPLDTAAKMAAPPYANPNEHRAQ